MSVLFSTWISNTATAATMFPIGLSGVGRLSSHGEGLSVAACVTVIVMVTLLSSRLS